MDGRKRGQYGARKDDWLDLSILLVGYSKLSGVSVGRALGVSENTGRARLNKPETLTIGELRRLCKAYDIPQNEIERVLKIGVWT